MISIQVNDTTAPDVEEDNFTMQSSYSNYSGSLVLNVSVFDNGWTFGTTFFNISRGNVQYPVTNLSINASQAGTNSTYWNATINTASFSDGAYNITFWVNDSFNNVNNTAKLLNVVFDNTAPTITLSSLSATKNSLTLTISASDALVGVNGTCTSNRPDAVISGSSSLIESSLNCGTTYPYTVNCYDRAGNLGSSTSTSFSTTSCGGGSVISGTTPNFWTGTTHVVNEAQFKQGFTKQIKVKERMKIKVGTAYHHVGVKEITTTSATIEIASDPVEIKLDVGEDAKVDVDADEIYDVYVVLNSIVNGKADLTIQSISEEIPEGEGAVSTTGEEVTPTDDEDTTEDETSLTWLWVLIVVVLVVVGFTIYKKRK